MKPPSCHLIACSRDARVEQIHTGLALLHAQGYIRLRQTVLRFDGTRSAPPSRIHRGQNVDAGFARLAIDGTTLHFDLADGDAIDEGALQESDFYFKRSYSAETVAHLAGGSEKVRPLGLNFPIYTDHFDSFALRRTLVLSPWRALPAECVRDLDLGNRISFRPRLRHFGTEPRLDVPPRILFMVRAWDPHDDPARSAAKIAEFHAVNETRAACIRTLRREFGDRFLGGFSHTGFALKQYPDVLAPDAALTTKRGYFQLLAEYPICVATTGLHGSIGWKVGEYTGLGKAIVTERLHYEVPGPFAPGSHYLEFQSADDCATAVARLCDDASLRRNLMSENLRYYREWVRPDRLVWNAIRTALTSQPTCPSDSLNP